MSEFLLAMGYGGDRNAAAWFEWNFRCMIGQEDRDNIVGRETFIKDFVAATENGQEYAIPVEDPSAPFVRQFGEYAKQALKEHRDLFAFYILEEVSEPHKQYRIYLKADEAYEIGEHQIFCDGFEVPREGLLFMQEQVGCRFYVTEDRSEMMMEFPYNGPEELPVL